jgi:hypothetical protein
MLPHSFPEANKVYTKPAGWTDEQCANLHVCQTNCEDGTPVIISYWKPSYEDLQALNNGGGIYLMITANVQPPVSLLTESPFSP